MNKTNDICTESAQPHLKWKKVAPNFLGFPYHHDRTLRVPDAREAVARIDETVKCFPFQIRYAMALPLWYRYANTFCITGDHKKAMAEIR